MPQPAKPKSPEKPSRRSEDADAAGTSRPGAEDIAAVAPVSTKIGEGEGHLRQREEAFTKRHGRTRPSG